LADTLIRMAGGGLFGRPGWAEEGTDPDYRFTLANERTFLAWIRTSLALLAAAVALVQLVPPFDLPGARTVLGVIIALDGLAICVLAYRRWAGNERAMRHGQTLPHSPMLALLATSLAVVGLIVLVLVITTAA
jgi:putative membrane protein